MDVVDLTGKVFHYLTIIKYVGKSGFYNCKKYGTLKGYHTWECECKCGKILNVRSNKIRNGSTKSCGCRKKFNMPIWTLPKGEAAKNFIYGGYRQSAKNRKLEFLLAKDYFVKIAEGNCYYCGIGPTKSAVIRNKGNKKKGRTFNGDWLYNGIDRADNNVGYVKDNCVSCCWPCNEMKKAKSQEEFVKHIKKIASNLYDKNEE